ncbi:MAG: DUF167 domain-containing protein [Elusimicrobia bacterium]|nr:DUF167 domain-containing protein [Candidatus Obscuribacterium magneticum]
MIIRVRAIPNAHHSEIMGRVGSIVRVRVAALNVEGKANEELVDFLAEYFSVQSRFVSILRGEKGKEKTVQIEGRPEHELEAIMDSIP